MQNRTKSFDEFVNSCKAPLEHMFNNHEFCGEEWCWAKSLNNITMELLEQHLIKDKKNENKLLFCQDVTTEHNKEVINPIDNYGHKSQTYDVCGKSV